MVTSRVGPVVEGVVGGREGAARADHRGQSVQVVAVVVTADQHLEHRLVLGHARPRAARRGTGRSARGSRRAPRCARCGPPRPGSAARAATSSRTPARTPARSGLDEGLVEPAEPDAARQVPDHREAQLGGPDQPFEQAPGPGRDAVGRRRLGDPALEQRGRDLDVGGGALLGEEDPEDRLLQLGAALAVLDAVVGEHRGEPVAELLREPAPVGVEALQVGVEVLLGAVHPQLGVQILARPGGCGSARRSRRRCPSSAMSSAMTSTPSARSSARAAR